ncbi:MAG: hypothetical protein ABH837_01190 [bacterium]
MKKNQKIQALKKQLLNQNFQSDTIKTDEKNQPATPQKNNPDLPKQKKSILKPFLKLPTLIKNKPSDTSVKLNKYTVESNIYVIKDLKKILIISTITVILLITLYLIRDNQIIKNLSDQIYILLHLQ